jgi:hypothetical protein
MPTFVRRPGDLQRPSPLLVLTGSALAALALISLGLAMADALPPPRAQAPLRGHAAAPPSGQGEVQHLAAVQHRR